MEEGIVGLVAGVGAVADIALALGNQDAVARSARLSWENQVIPEKVSLMADLKRMKTTTREASNIANFQLAIIRSGSNRLERCCSRTVPNGQR